jgi:hypothetical protein
VRENVTISYRGANFELGKGQNFYGIWPVAAPQAGPIEWWPETPEGWHGAWARFSSVESPGTITPVNSATPPAPTGLAALGLHGTTPPAAQPASAPPTSAPPTSAPPTSAPPAAAPPTSAPPTSAPPAFGPPTATQHSAAPPAFGPPAYGQPTIATPARRRPPRAFAPLLRGMGAVPADPAAPVQASPRILAVIAAGLLAVGVMLGIAGLFPGYFTGQALVQHQPEELVPHLIFLAGWTISAALILLGGARQRVGALLATGLSVVTLGMFVSDIGQITSANLPFHAGLTLSSAGWFVCAAGSVIALLLRPPAATAAPLGRVKDPVLAVTLAVLAALGAAAAFVPAWDGYTVRSPAGVLGTQTAGYAFAEPALMITGTVLVMVGLVLAVLIAALWRPVRLGAALLAGAAIPMIAQAVSAVIQIGEGISTGSFGIPPAQASRLGITVSASLTWSFWLYAAFVAALVAIFVWMLLPVRQTVATGLSPVGTPPPPPAGPPAPAATAAADTTTAGTPS